MDDRRPNRDAEDRRPSRRGILVAGGLITLAAAGGGTALGLLTERPTAEGPPRVPPELVAAIAAEQALIASVGAAARDATGTHRQRLGLVHADHVAHLQALRALVAELVYPARVPAASPGAPGTAGATTGATDPASTPPVRSPAQLRADETRAGRVAAGRALGLAGRSATVLASIAAAEAAHAELLA